MNREVLINQESYRTVGSLVLSCRCFFFFFFLLCFVFCFFVFFFAVVSSIHAISNASGQPPRFKFSFFFFLFFFFFFFFSFLFFALNFYLFIR